MQVYLVLDGTRPCITENGGVRYIFGSVAGVQAILLQLNGRNKALQLVDAAYGLPTEEVTSSLLATTLVQAICLYAGTASWSASDIIGIQVSFGQLPDKMVALLQKLQQANMLSLVNSDAAAGMAA